MSQYDEFTLDSRFLEYLHAAQNFKLTDRQRQYFNMRFGLNEDGHEARFHVYKEIAKSFRVTQPTVSSRLKVCKEKLKRDAYLEIKSGITNPNTRFILYLHNIFNIKYPGNIDYIMSLVDREDLIG